MKKILNSDLALPIYAQLVGNIACSAKIFFYAPFCFLLRLPVSFGKGRRERERKRERGERERSIKKNQGVE